MHSTFSNDNKGLLLGSEAVARGAYEAGVRLAAGYPGTPATPAIQYLIDIKGGDLQAEWAVNEKVALEMAIGMSWAGQRAFTAMKMSGLNTALDSLLSLATSGVRGGLVIMVGDDPGVHYGMVAQDSRHIARLAMLPMLEPSTPEEARIMTREAFDVSERLEVPVLIRQTTTTAAVRAIVNLEKPRRAKTKSSLPNDILRYTKVSRKACLAQHSSTLKRLAEAGSDLDSLNVLTKGSPKLGIIAPGSVWHYVLEALDERPGLEPGLLAVALVNPLPDAKIAALVESSQTILVVEELSPIIEERVKAVCHTLGKNPKVIGKSVLPETGDYDADLIRRAISIALGEPPAEIPRPPSLDEFTPRRSNFCPGCPHRSTYSALKKALLELGLDPKNVMVTGDVGCTIIGMAEPFSLCKTELVMGASIAMAQGFAASGIDTPVVAAIGDSTFLHSGIQPLLNAADSGVNLTVLIMDNNYAAMTGFQPTVPTEGRTGVRTSANTAITELARAVKAARVTALSPYFNGKLKKQIKKALTSKGVNVIVSQAPCVAKNPPKTVIPLEVSASRCKGAPVCRLECVRETVCSALEINETANKASIDKKSCIGCGLCAEACPHRAIARNFGFWRLSR